MGWRQKVQNTLRVKLRPNYVEKGGVKLSEKHDCSVSPLSVKKLRFFCIMFARKTAHLEFGSINPSDAWMKHDYQDKRGLIKHVSPHFGQMFKERLFVRLLCDSGAHHSPLPVNNWSLSSPSFIRPDRKRLLLPSDKRSPVRPHTSAAYFHLICAFQLISLMKEALLAVASPGPKMSRWSFTESEIKKRQELSVC